MGLQSDVGWVTVFLVVVVYKNKINRYQRQSSYLKLFEEDGCASPLHNGEQRLVSHEAHQAEGAGVPLFLPAHLLLQETSSDLILQL